MSIFWSAIGSPRPAASRSSLSRLAAIAHREVLLSQAYQAYSVSRWAPIVLQ